MAKQLGLTQQEQLELRARAILVARERGLPINWEWGEYRSNRTRALYEPQNQDVADFVSDSKPRYLLLKGGEGGGKSCAGVIKDLDNVRRGMSGIVVGPDLEHFKKSIWPTMREWIPWHCVIERHRHRAAEGWEPHQAFTLTFKTKVQTDSGPLILYPNLICGGAKEDQIGGWEGPNVSFVHFDEARRHKTSVALKVFDGRVRIPGPNGEPPQIYLTTTPRKHWLYDMFGPIQHNDAFREFKADSKVYTVFTEENIANLDPDFVKQRAQTLSEAERRILLYAEWEDESDVEKFVNMLWWNACQEDSQPIPRSEPCIIALDAATGSQNVGYVADCFALVMVSRHPQRREDIMVRHCAIWEPPPGTFLNFSIIEDEVRKLCKQFSVLEVCYDPYQLHDMATRLKMEQVAFFRPFGQQKERLQSDKQLQDLIMSRRIAHDGNPLLSTHIDNANVKKYGTDGIRIVKRSTSQKVDAAIALSMCTARCMYYNLT